MLVKWLCLLTPLAEPCHVVQRKLGHAFEAAGQVLGDYLAAVGHQRAWYNGAHQWKNLEGCVQVNTGPDTHSWLRLIPASHRMQWSEPNARRNKAFWATVPWVAKHLDSKANLNTKEEDVWEDCHDAGLLVWAVVYGEETYYAAHAASTMLHSCMQQKVPTLPKQLQCCRHGWKRWRGRRGQGGVNSKSKL